MNPNDIEEYILKISYKSNDIESSGSGVIINTRMDYFYIFTAKHTFFKEGVEIEDMDIKIIDTNGIKAENFHDKVICEKKSIIDVIEINKQDDFLIIVAKKNDFLEKVKLLAINPYEFSECVIYGYPTMKDNNIYESMDIPCNSPKSPKNNTFEVHSYVRDLAKLGTLDTSQNMKGLSGAGLYTEIKNKIYLSGIQIQGANGNDLLCFDIRVLSKDINKVLEEKNREPIGIFSVWKLLKKVIIFLIFFSFLFFYFFPKQERENISTSLTTLKMTIGEYDDEIIGAKFYQDKKCTDEYLPIQDSNNSDNIYSFNSIKKNGEEILYIKYLDVLECVEVNITRKDIKIHEFMCQIDCTKDINKNKEDCEDYPNNKAICEEKQ